MVDVVVILDPAFGERLESLSEIAPIWVVKTDINKATCERLWRSHSHLDHREKGAITIFDISGENPIKWLLDIVPVVEIHHGQAENNELVFPDGFVLQVIGVALNKDVMHALRGYGFTSFVETADGFHATKVKDSSPVKG